MKFRYFLGFLVSLEFTLGDYCQDQANSSSLNECFSKQAISSPCGRKSNAIGSKKREGGERGAIAHSGNINPFSKQ